MSRNLTIAFPDELYDWIMDQPLEKRREIYNLIRETVKTSKNGAHVTLTEAEQAMIAKSIKELYRNIYGTDEITPEVDGYTSEELSKMMEDL